MRLLLLLAVFAVASGSLAAQEITAQTPDGRKVILRADKTWDYAPLPTPTPTAPDEPMATCHVNSPENLVLRGLRLGMTRAEVEKVLHGSKPRASLYAGQWYEDKTTAYASFLSSAPFLLENKDFSNVSHLVLITVDDRLAKISLSYKSEASWSDVDEFATAVAGILNLPNEWQEVLGARTQTYQGITIKVAPNSVEFAAQPCLDLREPRSKSVNERNKKAFKP